MVKANPGRSSLNTNDTILQQRIQLANTNTILSN